MFSVSQPTGLDPNQIRTVRFIAAFRMGDLEFDLKVKLNMIKSIYYFILVFNVNHDCIAKHFHDLNSQCILMHLAWGQNFGPAL